MRTLATFAALACLLGPFAAAADPSPVEADAIHSVITRQIDAFRHDDAAGAFAFAAPAIQGQFGTASRFIAVVREAYQPVYRPRSVEFTALAEEDGETVQMVELIGPDGLPYTARYTMEHEADGSWRVSGCSLLASRRLGV